MKCGFCESKNTKKINNGFQCDNCDATFTYTTSEHLFMELGSSEEKAREMERQLNAVIRRNNFKAVDSKVIDFPSSKDVVKGFKDIHPDFGDIEALINLGDWLEGVLKQNGAEITDAGMGFGARDIGFTLEGMSFSASIKPRGETHDL